VVAAGGEAGGGAGRCPPGVWGGPARPITILELVWDIAASMEPARGYSYAGGDCGGVHRRARRYGRPARKWLFSIAAGAFNARRASPAESGKKRVQTSRTPSAPSRASPAGMGPAPTEKRSLPPARAAR